MLANTLWSFNLADFLHPHVPLSRSQTQIQFLHVTRKLLVFSSVKKKKKNLYSYQHATQP